MHSGGAIVTGATRRLGRAMAIFLAAKFGYDVFAHYHASHGDALTLQTIIQDTYGKRCLLFQSDLRDSSCLDRLVQHAFSEMPYCSTLINNASVFRSSSFKQLSMQEFEDNYNIHVKAPLFLTQHFVNACAGKGTVINIVDTAITRFKTLYFAYLLSKKSLADLTVMAAEEFAENMRINAVCPAQIPDHEIDNISSLDEIANATCLQNFLGVISTLIDPGNPLTGALLHTDATGALSACIQPGARHL
ncbi:MAG: SDR family NAD(P)-dependent oxidoreductase [Anaplasma sp.]